MRAIRPELDAAWDEVVRACLTVDQSVRPKSVAWVANALGLA